MRKKPSSVQSISMSQSIIFPNLENVTSTFFASMSNSSPQGSITKYRDELPFINNLIFINHQFFRTFLKTSALYFAASLISFVPSDRMVSIVP